ncbi:hypothetical protein WJX77_008951 [Trebouxia sp. C0004]
MSDHDDLGTEADMGFNSAASSADPAQRAQIKTFCSVTGADADSAQHVLEAHNWDMDRSVMFFLEGGASAPRQNQPAPAAPAVPRAAYHSAPEPIDLDDEMSVPAQPQPAHATGFAPPSEHELWEMDEDEQNLQRALQASMQPPEAGPASSSPMEEEPEDNESAAFGRMLATHNQNVQHRAQPLDDADDSFAGFNRGFLDGGGTGTRRTQARLLRAPVPLEENDAALQAIGRRLGLPIPPAMPSASTGTASLGAFGPSASFLPPPVPSATGPAAHSSAAMPDMPSDINVEEARMLEAAMLGIPYEGRIPDFTAQPAKPDQPMSPTAVAGRAVRQEQDYAYEQSLQADRDKRMATERVEREKREAEDASARQVAEQQAAADAKEASLKQTLQRKQQALPAEPGAGQEDVVQVAVRMPGGTRFLRRFRVTDQLGSLFDAIDVHTQGQNLPPGSYRCVAQYPRRVFTEGTPGSLRDVGLAQAKQETVLIEPID